METIRDWVERGGTLLVRDLSAVRTVEGQPIATPAGKGRVVDAGGSLERLAERVRTRDPQMTGLPPVDARPDGVLTSLFDDGILLFNRSAKAVTVELAMPAGRWDVDYPALPRSIHAPAPGHPVVEATLNERREKHGSKRISFRYAVAASFLPTSPGSSWGHNASSRYPQKNWSAGS